MRVNADIVEVYKFKIWNRDDGFNTWSITIYNDKMDDKFMHLISDRMTETDVNVGDYELSKIKVLKYKDYLFELDDTLEYFTPDESHKFLRKVVDTDYHMKLINKAMRNEKRRKKRDENKEMRREYEEMNKYLFVRVKELETKNQELVTQLAMIEQEIGIE